MKNILFFALGLLVFASCDSVAKHKPAIDALVSSWDAATAQATDFQSNLQTAASGFNQAFSAIGYDEQKFSKLKPDAQAQITAAKEGAMSLGNAFNSINGDLSTFLTDWTAKSAEVTALTDGLAAGKIEGDVLAKIAGLTSYISEGEAKLAGFGDLLAAAKTGAETSLANYQAKIAELIK